MKIVLYGASGTIGQRILNEALQRGHSVTAVGRDPRKITVKAPGLKAIAGDILSAENVAQTVAGADAVISAYGPGHSNPAAVVDATYALIEGLTATGVKRLLIVGGAGSLYVAPGVELVDAPQFPAGWKAIALAHRDALKLYRAEAGALDWTYISPAALIEPGARSGVFRMGGDNLLVDANGESKISAEDFAVALLDELEKPAHFKQRITVAY